jgi:hypothetical protein
MEEPELGEWAGVVALTLVTTLFDALKGELPREALMAMAQLTLGRLPVRTDRDRHLRDEAARYIRDLWGDRQTPHGTA